MKNFLCAILLLIISTFPGVVLSEDSAGVICPQLFPVCDADGNVASEFAESSNPCFQFYQIQCFAKRIQELEEKLEQCEERKKQNQRKARRYKRKSRNLKSSGFCAR